MTFTTTAVSARFNGDGSSRRFDLDFAFFEPADLAVVERRVADGLETPRLLGLHYAVEGGGGGSGAVVAAIAPPAGVEWHVRRATRRTQPVDYQENDAFPAGAHELALDRLQAQLQEVGAEQERTLRLSPLAGAVAPLPPLMDGAFLRAATDPDRLEWATLAEAGPLVVTPFMAQLLDDPTQAAAWATLGLGEGSGTVTSVDLVPAAGGAAGLSFGGGPVTGAGAISASLDFQGLPEEAAPNAAEDLVAIYSAAGAQHRRVRIADLPVPAVADGGITTPKLAAAAVTNAKLAAGAAIQGAGNATSGGGQVFLDRQGDTLRFPRIVVQRSVAGSGNAVSDANIFIATAGETITITLSITKTTIDTGGGGGGGGM